MPKLYEVKSRLPGDEWTRSGAVTFVIAETITEIPDCINGREVINLRELSQVVLISDGVITSQSEMRRARDAKNVARSKYQAGE